MRCSTVDIADVEIAQSLPQCDATLRCTGSSNPQGEIIRIAVFAGSAVGTPDHREATAALGRELAQAGVGVVYGGGRVGLMGVLADAALAAGGYVIGVMPRRLVEAEIAHRGVSRLDVVETMHERKARMTELADAFVALPGGAGTLEELFEVWTWGQLGLHGKPVALLTTDGFYTPLLAQLDAMVAGGYLAPVYRRSLATVSNTRALLDWIAGYRAPPSKWRGGRPTLTSVGWLRIEGGRLLAVRTQGRDKFYLPGGKLEPGETAEQALVREVHEELGVDLRDLRLAFTVQASAHGLAEATDLSMLCFTAAAVGDPRPRGEIDELAWLQIPDDPRAAPAVRAVLARLEQEPTAGDES